jgi:hypothetical protein
LVYSIPAEHDSGDEAVTAVGPRHLPLPGVEEIAQRSMSTRTLVWIGLSIGSLAGGYAPVLWGGDVISYSGLILSTVGGILGIWLGFKLGE